MRIMSINIFKLFLACYYWTYKAKIEGLLKKIMSKKTRSQSWEGLLSVACGLSHILPLKKSASDVKVGTKNAFHPTDFPRRLLWIGFYILGGSDVMVILIQSWVFSPLRGLGGDLVFKAYLSVCFREPPWGWMGVGVGGGLILAPLTIM